MAARADSPTGVQENADKDRAFHTDTKSPYCLPNEYVIPLLLVRSAP